MIAAPAEVRKTPEQAAWTIKHFASLAALPPPPWPDSAGLLAREREKKRVGAKEKERKATQKCRGTRQQSALRQGKGKLVWRPNAK